MGIEITTPNLDQGAATPELYRNQSRVKFELLNYNQFEVEVKKPSIISRIFSAIGNFAPLGLFFGPPGWIAGAGAAAGKVLADKSIRSHYMQEQQAMGQSQRPVAMTYPGLAQPGVSPTDPAISLLTAREGSLYSSSQEIRR